MQGGIGAAANYAERRRAEVACAAQHGALRRSGGPWRRQALLLERRLVGKHAHLVVPHGGEAGGNGRAQDRLSPEPRDDGPGGKAESRILDCLEKNGEVATFFYLGNRVSGDSENVKRAYDMGCEIGSHTWNHPNLSKLKKN